MKRYAVRFREVNEEHGSLLKTGFVKDYTPGRYGYSQFDDFLESHEPVYFDKDTAMEIASSLSGELKGKPAYDDYDSGEWETLEYRYTDLEIEEVKT